MAKQKIHELAKELKVASKVIVDYMNKKTKDKEKKYTSSNALEAEETADIKANLEMLVKADHALKDAGSQQAKQADPKAAQSKQQDPKAAAKEGKEGEARPKKKASITAVFNAQYS